MVLEASWSLLGVLEALERVIESPGGVLEQFGPILEAKISQDGAQIGQERAQNKIPLHDAFSKFFWGFLGALGASWRCLGASWRCLVASWRRLGASGGACFRFGSALEANRS